MSYFTVVLVVQVHLRMTQNSLKKNFINFPTISNIFAGHTVRVCLRKENFALAL